MEFNIHFDKNIFVYQLYRIYIDNYLYKYRVNVVEDKACNHQ